MRTGLLVLAGWLLVMPRPDPEAALADDDGPPPRTFPLYPDGVPGSLGQETGSPSNPGDVPTIEVYPGPGGQG